MGIPLVLFFSTLSAGFPFIYIYMCLLVFFLCCVVQRLYFYLRNLRIHVGVVWVLAGKSIQVNMMATTLGAESLTYCRELATDVVFLSAADRGDIAMQQLGQLAKTNIYDIYW